MEERERKIEREKLAVGLRKRNEEKAANLGNHLATSSTTSGQTFPSSLSPKPKPEQQQQ
jgi:hypothetical protein